MDATVVQSEKVQNPPMKKPNEIGVFRHQKWVDGEGRLWIVLLTFGHTNQGRFGANVELLNVDLETTTDVTRAEFEEWVRRGTLKRVEGPILI